MPNWMLNSLTISGKDAEKVMKSILIEDEETGEFSVDFNKIIPMPETLNMVSGSLTQDLMNLYLNSIKDDPELFAKNYKLLSKSRYASYTELSEKTTKQLITNYLNYIDDKKKMFEKESDIIAYGKQYFENIEKYGSENWYEWSVKNWGTKWNACETVYSEDRPCEVLFQTAWDCVPEIIIALSKKFPENNFYYEFAEEQYGNYCGHATYKNGEETNSCRLNDFSKEAYELSFSLWGEDESYRFNEEKGTYEYIEESEEDLDDEM